MSDAYLRSALFVDFDNVFIQLQNEDRQLAEWFASNPDVWVQRIAEAMPTPMIGGTSTGGAHDQVRRVLIRQVYLNPESFKRWRPYFVAAAFETVDCPPLTQSGKTSADIYMVLDMVDALAGPAHYDEFIVLSADSDFVPVLQKLRRHDRRTTVLTSGPVSRAYSACADLIIAQDDFVSFLNGDKLATGSSVHSSSHAPARAPLRHAESSASQAPATAEVTLDDDDRADLESFILQVVSERSNATMLAALGNEIKAEFGDRFADRGGYESLGALVDSLDLEDLVVSLEHPGYIYDPEQHSEPSYASNSTESASENMPSDMFDVARSVSRLTDTPLLTPEQYRTLFTTIADHVNNDGDLFLTVMSKSVRDTCIEKGQAVSRQAVNFVIRGLTFAGHEFAVGAEDAEELASIFLDNTRTLCNRAQMSFSDDEYLLLERWLIG